MVNARLLETTITNQFINVYFSSFQLYNWFAVLYKHTLRSIQTNAITLIFFRRFGPQSIFSKGQWLPGAIQPKWPNVQSYYNHSIKALMMVAMGHRLIHACQHFFLLKSVAFRCFDYHWISLLINHQCSAMFTLLAQIKQQLNCHSDKIRRDRIKFLGFNFHYIHFSNHLGWSVPLSWIEHDDAKPVD